MPVNRIFTPPERVIVPVYVRPDMAPVAPGAVSLLDDGKLRYRVDDGEPKAPIVHAPETVKALLVPAQPMVIPATVPLAAPELVRER